MNKVKPGINDLRVFGLIWTAICFGIGFYPAIEGNSLPALPIALGFLLLICALYLPGLLKLPFIIWVRLGEIIGAVVSRIILAIVFFFVVTPIGLILKIAGKDPLRMRYYKNISTYWIARLEQPGTLKNQY